MSVLSSLEPFTGRARRVREGARCEVCGAAIAEVDHRHVVDRIDRRLLCACAACMLAFEGDASAGRFRAVPDRVRIDPTSPLGDRELSSLGVPVGLAFFFRPSSHGRWVAVFPSPAGPTEAELPEEAFAALERSSALVRSIADDVEALLVRRHRDGRCETYAVPIDVCYELAALLRAHWVGMDGGDAARAAIGRFFETIAARSNEGGKR